MLRGSGSCGGGTCGGACCSATWRGFVVREHRGIFLWRKRLGGGSFGGAGASSSWGDPSSDPSSGSDPNSGSDPIVVNSPGTTIDVSSGTIDQIDTTEPEIGTSLDPPDFDDGDASASSDTTDPALAVGTIGTAGAAGVRTVYEREMALSGGFDTLVSEVGAANPTQVLNLGEFSEEMSIAEESFATLPTSSLGWAGAVTEVILNFFITGGL